MLPHKKGKGKKSKALPTVCYYWFIVVSLGKVGNGLSNSAISDLAEKTTLDACTGHRGMSL